MNKKRVALALAAALGINTLMVTVGQVGQQAVIAHAQDSRLTGDNIKLLDGIQIKTLETSVGIGTDGKPELTFTKLNNADVKNVTAQGFKHTPFGERTGIDSGVSEISGTWDSTTGKLKLNEKITTPGVYEGKVDIEFTDGTKETYTVSLRKTPSDSIKFTPEVGVGKVVIKNLKLNNGNTTDTGYVFDATNDVIELTNKRTGKTAKAKANTNSSEFEFSAIELADDGKLKENDVLELKVSYGKGKEYTLTSPISLVKQATPKIENTFVSNGTDFAKNLVSQVNSDFGVTDASAGTYATGSSNYNVTASGMTLFSYEQSIGSDKDQLGGAPLTVTSNGLKVDLTISAPKLESTENNYIYPVFASYDKNANTDSTGKTGLIGDYRFSIGNSSVTYFDATSGLSILKSTATNTGFVEIKPELKSTLTDADITGNKISLDLTGDLQHGYTPIVGTFGVDITADKNTICTVNSTLGKSTIEATIDETKKGDAKVSLIVVADALDGVAAQAKFEQTSPSEGKITIVGGRKIVGSSTDLDRITLSVPGSSGTSIIGGESSQDDLVFSVQFNGQVPSSMTWDLKVSGTSKATGTIETGVLEVANLKTAKATNNGTSNIQDQFRVEATFNLSFSGSTKVGVDGKKSDRVTLKDFTAGEHTIDLIADTGKYQGTYKAGVQVSQQPFTIVVKDAKSASNSSATFTIDANFINALDIPKVYGGVVQFREKTTSGWSEWKDSTTKITTSDVKEDPITKTVTGLYAGKTYQFRVYYDHADNAGDKTRVFSNATNEVTLPTSSNNSTITGNGSGSSTSGTSTGSTTITVSTSNSTSSGTTVSVNLPSGFSYDSGKTPVAARFTYKGKDGKTVNENRDQFSNVVARFNGNRIEIEGLVPGKDYIELTIDYTDKNNRVRSIVLRNVKTTSQDQTETYLANVYDVALGRPADEAGYHFHMKNLKDKKVSLREFLLNMLSEKEFVEKYKTTESKIEALYSAIVNRTSDEAGKKFWVDEYKKLLTVYGSESAALQAIADRMVNENELKEIATKMNVQW